MNLTDLGFTGTRDTPNDWQLEMLAAALLHYRRLGFSVLHEGDCVGADAEAAKIARAMGYVIHSHPPDQDRLRAHFPADREDAPLPYLQRNEVIVLASQAGIAVPNTTDPDPRSGTWSTARKMAMRHIPHALIMPTTMRLVA